MSEWQPIESAPRDGTVVMVAAESKTAPAWSERLRFPYPMPSKFEDGRWVADFGDRWASYLPQPSHWAPTGTERRGSGLGKKMEGGDANSSACS